MSLPKDPIIIIFLQRCFICFARRDSNFFKSFWKDDFHKIDMELIGHHNVGI